MSSEHVSLKSIPENFEMEQKNSINKKKKKNASLWGWKIMTHAYAFSMNQSVGTGNTQCGKGA